MITAASSFFVPSGPQDFLSHVGAHDCEYAPIEDTAIMMSAISFFILINLFVVIKFTRGASHE